MCHNSWFCVLPALALLCRQQARFLHRFCSERPGSTAAPLHPPFMLVQSLLSCLVCLSLLLRKLGCLLLIRWPSMVHSLSSHWNSVPWNLISHITMQLHWLRMGRISRNAAERCAASCFAESSKVLTNALSLLGCTLALMALLLYSWLHNQLSLEI